MIVSFHTVRVVAIFYGLERMIALVMTRWLNAWADHYYIHSQTEDKEG